MISYWEQTALLHTDIAVIGGGITGLSTALSLRARFPNHSIIVFERGLLPSGASTRNAGFACFGSLTELIDDSRTLTRQQALELAAMRFNGLQRLRQRCSDAAIDYTQRGSFELLQQGDEGALNALEDWNSTLQPLLGGRAFSVSKQKPAEKGFSNQITVLIENHYEGELHSGKLMRRLTELCRLNNIDIRTGTEIIQIEEEANEMILLLNGYRFKAGQVVHCTNAFAGALLPQLAVTPGRGQVLITHPVPGLRFKGIYHFEAGYFYFREIDGRVLFGGGRNLDFAGETTTLMGPNATIISALKDHLNHTILPGINYTIDRQWSGIMAFGEHKIPLIQQVSPRQFICLRMGGMGVALASEAGEQVAALFPEL
ncbi:MAG: FAD-dependent oxidoreductase [Chitinophagales bacterium]